MNRKKESKEKERKKNLIREDNTKILNLVLVEKKR